MLNIFVETKLRNYNDAKAQYSLFVENGSKIIFGRNQRCASQTKDPSHFLANEKGNYFNVLIPDALHFKELIKNNIIFN